MTTCDLTLGELIDAAPIERAGGSDLPVLSMTRARGLVRQDEVFKKKIASRDTTNYKVVRPGQLVEGIHIDEGAIGVSKPGDYGIVSPAYAIWDLPDAEILLPAYLDRFIRSPRAIGYFVAHYRQTAHRRGKLTKEQFLALEIPLPHLAEQKRIVAILDKADAIRRKRQAAMGLADDFLRATFLDMFGDPVTNPKGFEVLGLNNVGVLARGKSKHRPRNAPELLGGPYPLIQTGDVASADHYITLYKQTYSELGLKQSRLWSAGTLCITIAANIADTAILTFDACFPDSVVGFTPNDLVKTEYIHMWLTFYQSIIREKAPESAQKNINLKILSELKIPIPPVIKQEKFVDYFKYIETLKAKMRDKKNLTEDCFNSLTQRAFRGES